jgi:hypothetical protein
MMKFHAVILTPNGDVTAKAYRDGEMLMRDGVNRRMMDEFRRLLDENLTDDPTQCGKFRAQFGDVRHVFEWQQVEPLSAMAKFYVRGQIAAASFYLHGFVPELDDAVLEATEVLFDGWLGGAKKSRAACRGLRSIKERPVLIAFPGSKKDLSPADWRIIGNLCPCFAAVFFERAQAAIAKIEKFWNDHGVPTGGGTPDPLRN